MDEQVLSEKRYIDSVFQPRPPNDVLGKVRDFTTAYQEDIQRVVYSSSFRRMQNKTQVHPLPRADYLRNRLTHTIEVSEIGQLIAHAVGRRLAQDKKLPEHIQPSDIKDIVCTACLIHDIGNPPFGHNGEEAIQCWFERNMTEATGNELIQEAFENDQVKQDFLFFDGNAQSFRIANRLQNWRDKGGMRLTAAAVGASVKYPWQSTMALEKAGKKKFGYMENDKDLFRKIFLELGLTDDETYDDGTLICRRHPLAYIMEAADDIAYLTTDIEDGVKHSSIKYEDGEALLRSCCDQFHGARLESVVAEDDRIGYLRSAAIASIADAVYAVFTDYNNYEAILDGSFKNSLISATPYKESVEEIKKECRENLYTRREKLEIEAGGHHAIESVLDAFMGMANAYWCSGKNLKDISKKHRNIYHLLPKEVTTNGFDTDSASSICYKIVDYVSGMTDTYVMRIYGDIFGARNIFR